MAEVSQTAVHETKVIQYSHRELNAANGKRKCLAFENIFTIVDRRACLKPVYLVFVDMLLLIGLCPTTCKLQV